MTIGDVNTVMSCHAIPFVKACGPITYHEKNSSFQDTH